MVESVEAPAARVSTTGSKKGAGGGGGAGYLIKAYYKCGTLTPGSSVSSPLVRAVRGGSGVGGASPNPGGRGGGGEIDITWN